MSYEYILMTSECNTYTQKDLRQDSKCYAMKVVRVPLKYLNEMLKDSAIIYCLNIMQKSAVSLSVNYIDSVYVLYLQQYVFVYPGVEIRID